jgi:hypothetical protein
VIYHPCVRTCAKVRCRALAEATLLLRYAERQVEVVDLLPEPDPRLLDLCSEHAGRLTPPIGWAISDSRARLPAAV